MKALYLSIHYWNRCAQMIKRAKERPDLARYYEFDAAIYRMKFECYQALYFSEVKP